jgi:hypothetical protein
MRTDRKHYCSVLSVGIARVALRGITNSERLPDGRSSGRVTGLSPKALIVSASCLALLGAAMETRSGTGLSSLRQATVRAFDSYVAKTEALNAETLRVGPFLWVDSLQGKDRSEATAKLGRGEAVLRRLSVKADGGNVNIPGGMIHDWEGIVFIPGATIDDVLNVLQDYDHQATYYAPDVERSRTESRDGDNFRIFLRFRRKKIVTVVLNTEHQVTYYRDSPLRAHSRSSAFRIAQVEDPGGPHEKEKPPGEDDGFLWRMETWWRMEERDGGVYVQNQVVTLTRDIPTGLGWIIEPFITNIPKETLNFTMQATRKAVLNSKRS